MPALLKKCFLAAAGLAFIGCASTHNGEMFNDPGVPAGSNFRHVNFVSASATTTCYFWISNKDADLYRQVHQSLVLQAQLIGTNRKLVNLTVDRFSNFIFLSVTKTIHVSAEVIEPLPDPCCDSTAGP